MSRPRLRILLANSALQGQHLTGGADFSEVVPLECENCPACWRFLHSGDFANSIVKCGDTRFNLCRGVRHLSDLQAVKGKSSDAGSQLVSLFKDCWGSRKARALLLACFDPPHVWPPVTSPWTPGVSNRGASQVYQVSVRQIAGRKVEYIGPDSPSTASLTTKASSEPLYVVSKTPGVVGKLEE